MKTIYSLIVKKELCSEVSLVKNFNLKILNSNYAILMIFDIYNNKLLLYMACFLNYQTLFFLLVFLLKFTVCKIGGPQISDFFCK